jgi:hypothetical protein
MTNGDSGNAIAADIMRSIAAEYKWKEWQVVEKTAVKLDAATLAQYAGNFQLGPMKITVTQKGESLFISAPPLGPAPVELFASGQTTFFYLVDQMEFAFEANSAGKFDLVIKAGEPRKAVRI